MDCSCHGTSVWTLSCFPSLCPPPSPSFAPAKNRLSYQTDWTSKTFEYQFMELTFSLA